MFINFERNFNWKHTMRFGKSIHTIEVENVAVTPASYLVALPRRFLPLSPRDKDELPVPEHKCNKNTGPCIRLSLSKMLLRYSHVVYAHEYEQSTVYVLLETWAFSALGYYK